MKRVLQRKPPGQRAQSDGVPARITPQAGVPDTLDRGETRPGRFSENVTTRPVKQPKSRAQLIEEQLRNMPTFNVEGAAKRPEAVTRTGLRPRILGGEGLRNQYQTQNARKSPQNLVQFQQDVLARVRQNNNRPAAEQSHRTIQRSRSDARGESRQHQDTATSPHAPPSGTPLAARQEPIRPPQIQPTAKSPPAQDSGLEQPSNLPQTTPHPMPERYKCRVCGTPLLNLTFLKGEIVSQDQLLCPLCIERKYKEVQLLQLRMLSQKQRERNEKLRQISSYMERSALNQHPPPQSNPTSEQHGAAPHIDHQKLDEMDHDIQLLKQELESKNQQITQLQQQVQENQTATIAAAATPVGDSTEAKTETVISEPCKPEQNVPCSAEISVKSEQQLDALNVQTLQEQVQVLAEKMDVLVRQRYEVGQRPTTPPRNSDYQHAYPPRQSRILSLLAGMSEEIAHNFPFVVQRRVCSVCGEVLGVTIVDPRNEGRQIGARELSETLRAHNEGSERHEPPKTQKHREHETEPDINDIDVRDPSIPHDKRKRLDELFRLDERLGQLQIHETSAAFQPHGVLDASEPQQLACQNTEEKIDEFKKQEYFHVKNEAPAVSEASGVGDLDFAVRRQ